MDLRSCVWAGRYESAVAGEALTTSHYDLGFVIGNAQHGLANVFELSASVGLSDLARSLTAAGSVDVVVGCSPAAIATITRPRVPVFPRACLAAGCIVFARGIVSAGSRMGGSVFVDHCSVIDHDHVIDNFASLGFRAAMPCALVLDARARMQVGDAVGYGVGIDPMVTLRAEAAETGDEPEITRKNLKCH
jgi:hypothetical protein